jgi:hypothetical protein
MFVQVGWRSFPFRFFRNMALLRIASLLQRTSEIAEVMINLNGLHLEGETMAPPVQVQALFFEVTA